MRLENRDRDVRDLVVQDITRITRVGESLLISAGFNVDPARDNFGIGLTVEPRFLPQGRLGALTGARIPPAGAFGLE